MKLYLQILIIGILLFSSNCQTCTVGGGQGAADGYLSAPSGHASSVCVLPSGTCVATFSDVAGSNPSTTLTGDCIYCVAADEFLDRPAATSSVVCATTCDSAYRLTAPTGASGTCVATATARCLSGFTDVAGSAATQSPTNLVGPCIYCVAADELLDRPATTASVACAKSCAATYSMTAPLGASGTCVATATGRCLSGFTDVAGSAATTTGSLTGNCDKCVSATELLDRPATTASVQCAASCAATYSMTAPLGASGTCVATASGRCSAGFTDVAGKAAPTTGSLAGNCDKCVAADEFLDRPATTASVGCATSCATGNYMSAPATASGTCGTTCATGYTDKTDGSAAGSTLTGNCANCITDYTLKDGICEKSTS